MKGAIYESFGGLISVEDLPMPECPIGSVLVKVGSTGICRSDWHGWKGHDNDIVLPHVPGHEFAGTIVEIGNDIKLLEVGNRVVVPFCCGCGLCPTCISGKSHICNDYFQAGFTAWGSFAEYVRVDYADFNVQIIPDSIDFDIAAALGCRFITAYRAIVDQAKISSDQSVAIFGCGGVGLSAIMIAKSLNANIIAIDVNENSLQKARNFGADLCLLMKADHDVPGIIRNYTNGGVDASIDAYGGMECCINSLLSLGKNGKHIQVGLLKDELDLPQNILSLLIANELEIIGSHGMPVSSYPQIFKLIENGWIDLSLLLDSKLNLIEGIDFLQNMDQFQHAGINLITEF